MSDAETRPRKATTPAPLRSVCDTSRFHIITWLVWKAENTSHSTDPNKTSFGWILSKTLVKLTGVSQKMKWFHCSK